MYDLSYNTKEFIGKARDNGFCVEKLTFSDIYEITKKIATEQDQLFNFEIMGHLFEKRLIIHSFPFQRKKDPIENYQSVEQVKELVNKRRQVVKQLEGLAKDFIIG